jgi:hypothetical protein
VVILGLGAKFPVAFLGGDFYFDMGIAVVGGAGKSNIKNQISNIKNTNRRP